MYFLFFLFERNMFSKFFFFFQAEDGIRDGHVTGVQTCALPIWVSSAPAGADRASSTVVTTAAHSGVKSPFNTPAPPNVVSSRTDRSSNSPSGSLSGVSGRDRASISPASSARPRRSIPDFAAPTRIVSAASRQSSGSLSVHWHTVRANDSDISPSASARAIWGWAAARRTQAVCATAAPLVIRVRLISHARGL